MITAAYAGKNQNWQDGTTTYWFEINGIDCGSNKEFENETFGIVDCAGGKTVVDAANCSVQKKYIEMIVLNNCKIKEEMIDA